MSNREVWVRCVKTKIDDRETVFAVRKAFLMKGADLYVKDGDNGMDKTYITGLGYGSVTGLYHTLRKLGVNCSLSEQTISGIDMELELLRRELFKAPKGSEEAWVIMDQMTDILESNKNK